MRAMSLLSILASFLSLAVAQTQDTSTAQPSSTPPAFVDPISSFSNVPSFDSLYYYTDQCNTLLDTSNATGQTFPSASINYPTDGPPPETYNLSLSLTVSAPSFDDANLTWTTNRTLWMGVDKSVDYGNGTLPFSACLLSFNNLPQNSSNSGSDMSCATSLGQQCQDDLVKLAEATAKNITQLFNNFNNDDSNKTYYNDARTEDAVFGVNDLCFALGDEINSALPDSCHSKENTPGFGVDVRMPLTGPSSPALDACNGSAPPSDFYGNAFAPDPPFKTLPLLNSSISLTSQPLGKKSQANGTAFTVTTEGDRTYDRRTNYNQLVSAEVAVMRIYVPPVGRGNINSPAGRIAGPRAYMDCLRAGQANTTGLEDLLKNDQDKENAAPGIRKWGITSLGFYFLMTTVGMMVSGGGLL